MDQSLVVQHKNPHSTIAKSTSLPSSTVLSSSSSSTTAAAATTLDQNTFTTVTSTTTVKDPLKSTVSESPASSTHIAPAPHDYYIAKNADPDSSNIDISVSNASAASKSLQLEPTTPKMDLEAASLNHIPDDVDPFVVPDFLYRAQPPMTCCCCQPVLSGCCYVRRMGRMYVLKEDSVTDGNKQPRLRCIIGAGWSTWIITLTIFLSITLTGYGFGLRFLSAPFFMVAIVVFALGLASLIGVCCSNPGVFPRYLKKKEPDWRYCHQSMSFRPGANGSNVKWDAASGVLIEDIDHFCPWR